MPASSEVRAALVRLPEDVALHARPAGAFVREAARAAAEHPRRGERAQREREEHPRQSSRSAPRAAPSSSISASGADAAEALERLAELVSGLT